jgi:hypothetical protein
VHRDLYASHIFADRRGGRTDLYLIDLARVFRPRWRLRRWRVKDLAQLKYSMPQTWTAACWDEFLGQYLRRLSIDADRRQACWQRAIDRKVARMKDRSSRRPRGQTSQVPE